MDDDLSLVPIQDLVKALADRCDSLVIAWNYRGDDGEPDTIKSLSRYGGCLHTCLGLAHDMVRTVEHEIDRVTNDWPPEETAS